MSQFYQFSMLPFELRLQIWDLILPRPRLVEIRAISGKLLTSDSDNSDGIPFTHVYTTKSPVPAILQINSEARKIGLEHYRLTFDSNPRPSRETTMESHPNLNPDIDMPFQNPAMIYCDLNCDVLLPRREEAVFARFPIETPEEGFEHDVFRSMDQYLLQSVRYLVMPAVPFRRKDFAQMQSYFKCMTGLRGVVIIELGLDRVSEKKKEEWCVKVAKELKLSSKEGMPRVRMCRGNDVLEFEVKEGTVWDSRVIKDWD